MSKKEKTFGETLFEQRNELDLSRVQLAEIANVSSQTIYLIEKGEVDPREGTKESIAKALKKLFENKFEKQVQVQDKTEKREQEEQVDLDAIQKLVVKAFRALRLVEQIGWEITETMAKNLASRS